MDFKNYLIEASYGAEDIPKNFFIVFDLDTMKDNLAKYTVPGLKGISGNNEIEFLFLGVGRDAILIMNGQKVINENKLSRIMYNNPHYLVSNNLSALMRMWDKRRICDVYANLFDYMAHEIKLTPDKKWSKLYYGIERHGAINIARKWGKHKVKNIYDLSKYIKSEIDNNFSKETGDDYSELTSKDYLFMIVKALTKISDIYGNEAEWLIKDKTFKIPKGSEIQLLIEEPRLVAKDYKKYIINKEKFAIRYAEESLTNKSDPMLIDDFLKEKLVTLDCPDSINVSCMIQGSSLIRYGKTLMIKNQLKKLGYKVKLLDY